MTSVPQPGERPAAPVSADGYLVEMRNISVSFGGVHAVDDVSCIAK